MTRLFLITFLFILLGCDSPSPKQTFLLPDKKDINEIIETVINYDSTLLKNITAANTNNIPMLLDLRKIRVILIDTTTDVPPPVDLTTVSVFNLFNSLVDNQRFFSRADSLYFFFQNDAVKTFTIYKTLAEKLATTTLFEQQQKHDSNQTIRYYDLTIPIFSADNKKAYIEWTTNCSGCGGATSFYLEKIINKWTVVGWQRRWMN